MGPSRGQGRGAHRGGGGNHTFRREGDRPEGERGGRGGRREGRRRRGEEEEQVERPSAGMNLADLLDAKLRF